MFFSHTTVAKCILSTVMRVVFFVLTLNVSGDRTRVELHCRNSSVCWDICKVGASAGHRHHLQGRSFRRSQATPARSELPQVTGNTCKVAASAGHRQHLQGRSFRRSRAAPARSQLPRVTGNICKVGASTGTGNTCKVGASAGHRQHLQGRKILNP